MPSSVNPHEIAVLREGLYRLGADSVTLVTHQQDNAYESCIVGWGTHTVYGMAPLGQVGGAMEDAMRKLRDKVAEEHPEVELPGE